MYVQRDSTGKIIGAYANAQDYATEHLADTDTGLVAFLNPLRLPSQAQSALGKSDTTMLRCLENGVAVPPAWTAYRKALRAIANGSDMTSTALPATPVYPAGT